MKLILPHRGPERTTAMIVAQDRTQLVEDLARMMDGLCEPDLTLARADVLRPRVIRLLEALREANDRPHPYAIAGRVEGDCRMAGLSRTS